MVGAVVRGGVDELPLPRPSVNVVVTPRPPRGVVEVVVVVSLPASVVLRPAPRTVVVPEHTSHMRVPSTASV